MARLSLKTPTTPVGNAGLKRKHEGTTNKGDLPAEDLLEMRSSPFQKEKRVTMKQKSEGIESTGSQCYISVKKVMHRAAEVTGCDTFESLWRYLQHEDSQDPFDVGNEVGPQVVGSGTVVEVVGIKSLSKDPFDRLQELHAEVLTTKECHKALQRLMDKQHQELSTLKEEAKEADAARKSQSDEIECLKKQTKPDNVRLQEQLKLHHLSPYPLVVRWM
ncbi:hypothetical protein EJB05_05691, partial [Eragrostis curvula]